MTNLPEELQQRIAAYLDGELPPAEAARLEVFLANTDPRLADMLVGMLADKVQVRALPRPKAPVDLSARIMESIERASLLQDVDQLSAPRRRWWQTRGAIAAGVALVLGGFSYFIIAPFSHRDNGNPWKSSVAASNASPATAKDAGPQLADSDAVRRTSREGDLLPAQGAAAPPAPSTGPTDSAGALALAPAAAAPVVPPEPALAPPAVLRAAEAAPALAAAPAAVPAATAPAPADAPDRQLASSAAPPAPNVDLTGPIAPLTPRGRAAFGGGGAAPGGGGGGFGGGGGGGGFAGGRGGRGGGRGGAAGPRAGRGIAPGLATGQPGTPANAPQVIEYSADNAARTAAALAQRTAGGTPLVITLQATDDQSFGKLANDLTAFAIANAAPPADQTNSGAANGAMNVQNAPNLQNLNGNTNGSATAGGITLNGGNVIVLDYNAQDGATQGGATTQLRDQAQSYAQSAAQTLQKAPDQVQQAAAKGGPYRVTLHRDQIAQLARDYRVSVLSRGDDTYQFHAVGDDSPAGVDPKDRAALLEKAGLQATGNRQAADGDVSCVITMESAPVGQQSPAASPQQK